MKFAFVHLTRAPSVPPRRYSSSPFTFIFIELTFPRNPLSASKTTSIDSSLNGRIRTCNGYCWFYSLSVRTRKKEGRALHPFAFLLARQENRADEIPARLRDNLVHFSWVMLKQNKNPTYHRSSRGNAIFRLSLIQRFFSP